MSSNTKTAKQTQDGLYPVSFHDDMSILLDIYEEGITQEQFLEKVGKSGCPPEIDEYPLIFGAKEAFIPRIIESGAAPLLKKIGGHMSVRQFRQILTALFINENEVIRTFMVEVVAESIKRGRTAVYAKEVFDFAERFLKIRMTYKAFELEQSNVSTELKREEVLLLTKQIITALNAHGLLSQMHIHQDSKALIYEFKNLEIYDTTIIFLMYWLKNLGNPANVAVENPIWHRLGISTKVLVERLSSTPSDKFFKVTYLPRIAVDFGYVNTTEGINRMRVLGY